MNINFIKKMSLCTVILLTQSCASANEIKINELSFSKQLLELSDSNNLETKDMVSFFGEYTITQPIGLGTIFNWESKRTVDNFMVSEITASNWKEDPVDILRNINMKIDTVNCYSYANAESEIGLDKILISPPNPHASSKPELKYYSVKYHAWGSANYFFNRKQCLEFIRFTANPNFLLNK